METLGAGLAALAFWGFVAALVVGGLWHEAKKREAEHETLRIEYERVSRELRERCHTAEGRQQLAVQQLETLLARLRQ